MTAYREVHLWCDYREGCKPFEPPPGLGYAPLSVVRREARKAGWTVVRSSLGRRFDKDYCPDHPEGSEITEAQQGDLALIAEVRAALADGSARRRRELARISVSEMAAVCGVSRAAVSMWERRGEDGQPLRVPGTLLALAYWRALSGPSPQRGGDDSGA